MKKIIIPLTPDMRDALAQLGEARKKLRDTRTAVRSARGPGELEDRESTFPARGGQVSETSPRRGEKTLTTGIAAGMRDGEGLRDKSGVSAFTSRREG